MAGFGAIGRIESIYAGAFEWRGVLEGEVSSGRSGMMFESESLLRQETTGERLELCDVCGNPTAHAAMVVIDGDRAGSEPVEEMRICPACRERMYRDDLAIDDELTPNIEPDDE